MARIIRYLSMLALALLTVTPGACDVSAMVNNHQYHPHGWVVPLLYGASKVGDEMVDFDPRVNDNETRRELFDLPDDAGRVYRLSHNGRVFCYIYDHDQLDPWDFQVVDYDGSGAFEKKEPPLDDFPLPRWTFVNYPYPHIGGREGVDMTGGRPTVDALVSALSPDSSSAGARKNEAPRVALNILFEFDKDVLTDDAKATLSILGQAMTTSKLKGGIFRLEGHTDAVGSYDYNMDLSRRRAVAAQKYLLENFSLTSEQLIPVGLGESQPLPNLNPEDGRNRRVEIVNLSAETFLTNDESPATAPVKK